jgi:hypothetical protein
MTKDDIIRMAREVDPVTKLLIDKKLPQGMDHDVFMWFLTRFAALVAAAEREACATACEEFYSIEWLAQHCAAAIRARGNT